MLIASCSDTLCIDPLQVDIPLQLLLEWYVVADRPVQMYTSGPEFNGVQALRHSAAAIMAIFFFMSEEGYCQVNYCDNYVQYSCCLIDVDLFSFHRCLVFICLFSITLNFSMSSP